MLTTKIKNMIKTLSLKFESYAKKFDTKSRSMNLWVKNKIS
jgi:hypothetical protein